MRYLAFGLMICALAISIGCSDDDEPVGSTSTPPPMAGVWLFDSASTNGSLTQMPPDTLRYRSDYTGSYRSSLMSDWDPYDFSYSTYIDTIIRVRTAGDYIGKTDTSRFELSETHLMMQIIDSIGTRTYYLTRAGQ